MTGESINLIDTLIQEGDQELEVGHFSEAIDIYSQVVTMEPRFWAAHYKLGNAWLCCNELEKSKECFEIVLTLNSESHWGHYGLGLVATRSQLWSDAEAYFKRSAELQPDFYSIYVELGAVLTEQNRYVDAISAYQKVLELKPEHELIKEQLEELHLRQGTSNYSDDLATSVDVSYSCNESLDANFSSHSIDTIIDNAVRLITINPSLYEVDIDMELERYLDPKNFDEQKVNAQLEEIRARVNQQYRDKPLDGLLNEIASLQLAVSELNLQLKVMGSRLLLRDSLLPELMDTSADTLADTVTIEAGYPLSPAQGFYQPDYDKNGNHFRWTGPKTTFFFDLYLSRKEQLKFQVYLLDSEFTDNILNLKCFGDSTELPLSHRQIDGIYVMSGILPARRAFGCTRLSFIVPNVSSPDNDDERELGVAFSKLIVQPLKA